MGGPLNHPAEIPSKTSHAKISAALERAESVADDPEQTVALRTAAAALMMFREQLVRYLPAEVDELDAMLGQGAQWLIGLRSDTADPLFVIDELGEPDDARR